MEEIKCNFNLNVDSSKSFYYGIFLLNLVVYVFSVGKNAKSIGLFFPLASWGLCSNVPSTGPVGG